MNYDNFLREENNKIVFVECWMDRCIDRNDEYIPSYPYWNDEYTPNSWVSEGLEICKNKASEQTKSLMDMFAQKGILIESVVLFDEGINYKPEEETGWNIYSIDDFLSMEHEKISYEGYVYYGYSKIIFSDGVLKEDILDILENHWDN